MINHEPKAPDPDEEWADNTIAWLDFYEQLMRHCTEAIQYMHRRDRARTVIKLEFIGTLLKQRGLDAIPWFALAARLREGQAPPDGRQDRV